MAITNQSKPSASVSNSSKVSVGETWATVTTTWATETRTWNAISKLIANIGGVSVEYLATEALDFLMTEDGYYIGTGVGLISNQQKPI